MVSIIVYGLVAFTVGKTTAGNDGKVEGVSIDDQQDKILEKPIPSDDIQSNKIHTKFLKFCANTAFGFELAYPSDWFTTYNSEDEQCKFFAPYSFIVPEFIDKNFVPINLETLNSEEWLGTVSFFENPNDFYNIISSKNIEINGRLVKEIEAQTTGEGTLPKGFIALHYLVFDGEKPIRFSYYQLAESDDIIANKVVLKEIVESLKYF